MAKRIEAIRRYRPRLKRVQRVEPEEFAAYVAAHSRRTVGDVRHALYDLSEALQTLLREGKSVRLEGIGLLMPGIDTQGNFTVHLKPDRALQGNVQADPALAAIVINHEHIGKSSDALVALWNCEHPENPVE